MVKLSEIIESEGKLEDLITWINLFVFLLFVLGGCFIESTICFLLWCAYTTLPLIVLNKLYIEEVWFFQNEIGG